MNNTICLKLVCYSSLYIFKTILTYINITWTHHWYGFPPSVILQDICRNIKVIFQKKKKNEID